MIIENLKLTNFRSHKKYECSFVADENIIVGPNGAGKTNILEAIYLLSTGTSFRAKYDHEMIYNPQINGGDLVNIFTGHLDQSVFARVVGNISNNGEEDTLEVLIVKDRPDTLLSRKIYKINGTTKRVREASGIFTTVLFTPQDLDLFNGSPALRRRFMDDMLYQTDPRYKKEHTMYTKSVKHRNKILEKINKTGSGKSELSIWTEKILQSGRYIQQQRTILLTTIIPLGEKAYSDISSHKTDINLEYNINEISEERLNKHRDHEIYAKTTLIGPHRDDFSFNVNGFNINSYGSRGQQRTAVLALKLSELDILEQTVHTRPTLLLDDIFSELDEPHKNALKNTVQKQQTIITTTNSTDYLHSAGNMQILS